MKTARIAWICMVVAAAALLFVAACNWDQSGDSREKHHNCFLNPGYEAYDCADACCDFNTCEHGKLYTDYGTCVGACDKALYESIEDKPQYSSQYKNCVLDCIYSCQDWETCRDTCLAQLGN